MELPNTESLDAIPWQFNAEEVSQLRTVFKSPLVHAYLQSLKYLALSNKLVPPEASTLEDVKASNDFMAGQEYILDAMLAAPLYVTTTQTKES